MSRTVTFWVYDAGIQWRPVEAMRHCHRSLTSCNLRTCPRIPARVKVLERYHLKDQVKLEVSLKLLQQKEPVQLRPRNVQVDWSIRVSTELNLTRMPVKVVELMFHLLTVVPWSSPSPIPMRSRVACSLESRVESSRSHARVYHPSFTFEIKLPS